MKEEGEAVHFPLKHRTDGFGRYVARRKAGASGGDDDVNPRVGNEGSDLGANGFDIVANNRLSGKLVAGTNDSFGKERSGAIRAFRARVRNRQNSNSDRKKKRM